MSEKKQKYAINIWNQSEDPLADLHLLVGCSPELEPISATDGSNWGGDDLEWVLKSLPSGKAIRYQLECSGVMKDDANIHVRVISEEGAKADADFPVRVAVVAAAHDPRGKTIRAINDSAHPPRRLQ